MGGFARLMGGLCLLGLALAQGGQDHRDALHGFRVFLPQDYSLRVRDYGLLLGDLEAFLLVRGMPLKGPREAVALLVQEAQRVAQARARYHFKEVPGGLLLLIQGLSYPFPLAEEMAALPPPAYQDPFLLGLRYEASHLLLPGAKSLLLVSAYLPTDASFEVRKRLFSALRSLEFLPQEARVAYGVQAVRDPLLGMEAFHAKVPQGYAFQAGLVPVGESAGAVRDLVYLLQGEGVFLRKERVFALAYGVQTGFGGNASTLLGWNGQKAQLAGFLCPRGPEEVARFLLELWRQETGRPWQIRKAEPYPQPTGRVFRRIQELHEAYWASMTAGLPVPLPQQERFAFALEAASGGLLRQAMVAGLVTSMGEAQWVASSAYCDWRGEVYLKEGRAEALARANPVFLGFQAGIRSHPEWPWREALRARRASIEETERVLRWVREQQEFNTWMRQSWANLLSDQTYVRDPSTGEVFRAYKASFDTGTFWRDPVFGGVVGAVERGGRLEEMLRQGGWRQLEESLSGLPGTWRR
ncbi:hypothetical protein TCCBUS3UF1_16410 [Thermus sp. CCB_US3_UF1]|nr:hypothetical protein TCCBUS3UF1_16410 [Thermus sp. CCB_US3_UF1]